MDIKNRVCLITGGNGGIGRATADELARRGAIVVLLCRSRERGEAAQKEIIAQSGNPKVDLIVADLSVQADVRRAAEEFLAKHKQLHVLINNAAVFLAKREVTVDGVEKTFAINYLSHFLLTHLLLDVLKASAPSRIINVATKTMGLKMNLDDLMSEKKYSTMGAVGPTKLGLILFTRELAKKLEGTGVTVNALHPGLVKTDLLDETPWLMRKMFHLMSGSPEKGARTPVYLATADEVANVSGKLFCDCKEIKVGAVGQDDVTAQRLWEKSVELAHLQKGA